MNLLKIDDRKAYFLLPDEKIQPEKLSKEQLLEMLNLVFENNDDIVFPCEDDFKEIINPIEKEIVEQIISKIKGFHENVPNIETEINNQFPGLDSLKVK